LRNAVFDKCYSGARVLEAHSTGRLDVVVAGDVDRFRLLRVLADLLRQFFSAVFLFCVLFGNDPWRP
jgi:hypothetical protein